MKQVWSGGVLFVLLAVLVRGQLDEEKQGCAWDVDTDIDQGLDPKSLDAGASYLAHLQEISDSKGCQDSCCGYQDCQLALVGTPANGTSECFLVNCMKDGKDVCVLQSDTQFKVYRKKTHPKTTKVEVDDISEAGVPTEVNSTDKCLMPMVVGSCRAAFPKYYYDVTNQTCKLFIYGGCNGNGNNFYSQEECEGACSGVTGTVLLSKNLPMQRRMAMTADDQVTIIAGSKGRKGSDDDKSIEYKDACMVPSDSGPCRAAFNMFYFDHSTSSCQSFIYGGCQGNSNRYVTLDECMARCTGEQGLFLVATVAVISALILMGLIGITIRRSKLHRGHRHLGDKEDLLPYEQLFEEQLPEEALPKVGTAP
ncbi:kunitz-type protease inhibitor 2 isoform X2 [Salmo salar]|uniref:Kunitz-type protease inhibitor 2 isoform X2 n=1 Tax=Salmo salar TaxID=8030 RepID=A0ABM3FAP4_SALSA|nr:kunitz-type protease inhibitor 2 isoform X2 [Salmo salar]